MIIRELSLKKTLIVEIGYLTITRQVCSLFKEPVKQPLGEFRIAEEKNIQAKYFTKWTP